MSKVVMTPPFPTLRYPASRRFGSGARQVSLSLFLGVPLDRVPEHCPRHSRVMLRQEGIEDRSIPVSHFAQHPPNRLVNQVLAIVDQKLGDRERRPVLAFPDEILGSDHRNPALPEIL